MKFELNNDKGIGLVFVLFLGSVIGITCLYFLDLFSNTHQKLALDAKVQSYQNLVKTVTNKLHSGTTCSDLLSGTNLDVSVDGKTYSAFSYEGLPISLDLKLTMNERVLQAPVNNEIWALAGGTSIKDVRLFIQDKIRAPVRLDLLNSPLWTAALGYILIFPDHTGVGVRLPKNNFYRIPIFLYLSTVGTQRSIVSCSGPNNEAHFCTLTGGAYDSSSSVQPNGRCHPDRSCIAYKMPIVNSISDCPLPYKAHPIGHIGGTLYICNWCNQNIPLLPPEPAEKFFQDPTFLPEWY